MTSRQCSLSDPDRPGHVIKLSPLISWLVAGDHHPPGAPSGFLRRAMGCHGSGVDRRRGGEERTRSVEREVDEEEEEEEQQQQQQQYGPG